MSQHSIQSINLSRLLREGGSTEAKGELGGPLQLGNASIALEGNAVWKASVVSVSGEVGHGHEFWVSGEVAGNALMECRRCLKPTSTPVRAHFQHMLRYQSGLHQLEVVEEGDEEIFLFGHPDLDLTPFLSEAFALELPYTALCREDCKGLCPVCGANRNDVDCGHSEAPSTKLSSELDRLLGEIKE